MPEISRFLAYNRAFARLATRTTSQATYPHCTSGVNMFLHTTHIQALPDYRLHIVFNNGVSGEVSLLNELWGDVFEPLKNEQLFATARHDEEMGTVVWANGADFAPEFLMNLLQLQTQKAA